MGRKCFSSSSVFPDYFKCKMDTVLYTEVRDYKEYHLCDVYYHSESYDLKIDENKYFLDEDPKLTEKDNKRC